MKNIRRMLEKKLGDILIDLGVINEEQLSKALVTQQEKSADMPTGEILIDLGFAKEEDILQAFCLQYRFPYLPVRNYEITNEVINRVPVALARKHHAIPIDKVGETLTVAMSNPLNRQALTELECASQCRVHSVVDTASEILRSIDKYYDNADLFKKLSGDCS